MNDIRKPLSSTTNCVTCGTKLYGNFCSNCGEERINKKNYSLPYFLKRFIKEITNIDSRVYTSFKLLLTRPGFLSDEHLKGKRKLYLKPLQMFLIANLLYFFIQPYTAFTGLNSTLASQMNRQLYSQSANIKEIVEKKIESSTVSYHDYEIMFNKQSSIYARSLVFIIIIIFALFLSILFYRKREFVVEHLEFSTHYMAWYLLYIGTFFFLFYSIIFSDVKNFLNFFFYDFLALAKHSIFGKISSFVVFVFSELSSLVFELAYLYFAVRYFYKESRKMALLKSFVLYIFFFLSILIFRYILFWVTYLTV